MLRLATVSIAIAIALATPARYATRAAAQAPAQVQAQAQAATAVRATIVRIEGADVFLDVGRDALAGAGRLTVFRRVVVRHPLTRRPLEDRFAIGELEIVQAGETLALARAVGTPAHPFGVGDRAETAAAAAAAPASAAARAPAAAAAAVPSSNASPASAAGSAPSSTAPAASATAVITVAGAAGNGDAEELLRYFHATLAQTPAERIGIYQSYLRRFPNSRYRSFVEQELRYLRAWHAAAVERARDAETTERAALLASAVELLPPSRLPAGSALVLAARVRPEARVRGLVLHVRARGGELYRTLPMQTDGRGHAQARVPSELVEPPGFEFFIEAVNDRGESAAAFASAAEPHAVLVERPAEPPERRRDPAMRVRISSELASFDGTSGRDYFVINEGDFFYRLRHGSLYGIRMGYGRFDGQGGTVEQLDQLGLAPRRAGFTYAFFEGELAASPLVGVALRGTLGLGRPDPGEEGEISGGFQTRLRLGDPNETNLVIAGELLPEIGQRALLHLGWELIDRVPMAAEVQVTDQPVNSDEVAVRIVYELGYRFGERVAIALRPSYQLRTIRHAGPGVGLSATFDW